VRVQRRDDDARRCRFETAYRTLYDPICGYVLRRVSDPDDAAEVVAETFLTLWRRFDDAPSGAELRPWLFGVARRTAANQRRGDGRRSALAQRLAADFRASELAAPVDERPELNPNVARAFAGLTESDRELLSLVAWEGLSHEELAVALGVSRPVVRLRLHRARRRFSAALNTGADMKRIGSAGHVPLRQAAACPGTTKGES
jgi:RNA polymerase sigma-70 factor, ECF subfamily